MKLIRDKQDLLTAILVTIWAIMLIALWTTLGSLAAVFCNTCWIILFGILTLAKWTSKRFQHWLYTPLKKREGK